MEHKQLADKLLIIKQQIEAKKGLDQLENWRYSQYKELSDEISKSSGIRISHTTLIRIFKKQNAQNIPQLSTLKALVLYLGYESWESFLQSTENKTRNLSQAPKRKVKGYYLFISLLFIVIVSITSLIFTKSTEKQNEVYLELTNDSLNFPQVLTFKYKVPSDGFSLNIIPKSFLPYTTSKKLGKIPLPKEDTIVNSKFTLPDHFILSITKGNKAYLQEDIELNTGGWLGIIQSKERKAKQQGKYRDIIFQPSLTKGVLQAPNNFKKHIKENILDRYFETNFMYVEDFDVDANRMIFETSYTNTSNHEFIAGQLNRVTLLTTNGLIEIPIINENYIQHAKIWFSDHIASYKKSLMHQLVVRDISKKWIKLRIETSDFEGKIYINNKLIDTINYETPLGTLTGIRYKFTDNGEVDYCKLMNHAGDTLFLEQFNESEIRVDANLTSENL